MIFKLKRSPDSGKIPLTTDLEFGELAINYEDGIIYYKKADNTIASITNGSGDLTARAVTEIETELDQVIFTQPGGYTVGFIDVIVDGITLNTDQFVAEDGDTIELQTAPEVGTIVRLVSYNIIPLANIYQKEETDNLAITMAIALG